jgi:competence protein ComEC
LLKFFTLIFEMVLEEQDRWVLWVPVLFGLGILAYFGLQTEQSGYAGILALILVLAVGYSGRGKRFILWSAISIGIMIAGFSAAQFRTASLEGPILAKAVGPTTVTGQVTRVEMFPTGSQLTLEKLRISGVGPADTPNRIRLRVRSSKGPDVGPGDWIRTRARITPPPPPAMSGAFDFKRHAFFKGLGGVGFSYGAPKIITQAKETSVIS